MAIMSPPQHEEEGANWDTRAGMRLALYIHKREWASSVREVTAIVRPG